MLIGSDAVQPVQSARDLGIYLDDDLSMSTHVTKTMASCFAVLRQLRSIRRSLTRPVLLSLVTSLVLTRLDYGLSTLAAVGTQRGGSDGVFSVQIRPHHAAAQGPALATSARANRVQTLRASLSLSAR